MSKKIKAHPAVKICELGHATGSEHKYDVLLHEDWHFAGLFEGNPNDRRQWSGFDTVAEFLDANPQRIAQ